MADVLALFFKNKRKIFCTKIFHKLIKTLFIWFLKRFANKVEIKS